MTTPERDTQSIRFVGSLIAGLGVIQLLLTILITLFMLFTVTPANEGSLGRNILLAVVALILASTMAGCGAQLQSFRAGLRADIQSVRLAWTALVVVATTGAMVGAWLGSALTLLALAMLLALLGIRGAIIRLSHP